MARACQRGQKTTCLQPSKAVQPAGGSGLGLAISAELIRGHGGRLRLEKSDAAGSIFTIELPKINN